jgi:UDP-2,4-diacetamido-2,4,6-trideoxy-beta-L-altropyranose hydrolase
LAALPNPLPNPRKSRITTKVVIRCSAGERIGYGHLRRCLALADAGMRRGWQILFVLDDDADEAAAFAARRGHSAITAGRGELTGNLSGDIVILDLAHFCRAGFRGRLEQARQLFAVSSLIDGLPPYSFAAVCDGLVDVLVVPYIGPRPDMRSTTRVLLGPAWAPFDSGYEDAAKARQISAEANRVLVTMGGADPTALTVKALEALHLVQSHRLEVRVVIGPFFADSIIAAIERAADREALHRIDLIRSPDTLAWEMARCDVALAATGLTKYELALTGTPSLQISIDPQHAEMNEAFARTGAAADLGVADRLGANEIAGAVTRLLGDAAWRRAMAAAGRRLVDSRGAGRLVDELAKVREGARASV